MTLAGYNLQDNVYIYSNNKCMCVFLISPVPIAEPLTSELIDTPVFYNLAPRPIKYRVSVPIPNGMTVLQSPKNKVIPQYRSINHNRVVVLFLFVNRQYLRPSHNKKHWDKYYTEELFLTSYLTRASSAEVQTHIRIFIALYNMAPLVNINQWIN